RDLLDARVDGGRRRSRPASSGQATRRVVRLERSFGILVALFRRAGLTGDVRRAPVLTRGRSDAGGASNLHSIFEVEVMHRFTILAVYGRRFQEVKIRAASAERAAVD